MDFALKWNIIKRALKRRGQISLEIIHFYKYKLKRGFYLSEIDKVHEGCEVNWADVLEEQDWVLPRVHRLQDGVKVSGAGREDDSVGFDLVAFGGQGDVGETLVVPQAPERLRVLLLVLVPPKTKVLVRVHPHHLLWNSCICEN